MIELNLLVMDISGLSILGKKLNGIIKIQCLRLDITNIHIRQLICVSISGFRRLLIYYCGGRSEVLGGMGNGGRFFLPPQGGGGGH